MLRPAECFCSISAPESQPMKENRMTEEGTPIRPAPPGHDTIAHARLPAHLVRRAVAFTEGRIGKCSPSASIAYFLEMFLPAAERSARWDALHAAEEAEMHAHEPTDDELDPSKDDEPREPDLQMDRRYPAFPGDIPTVGD